MNVHGIEYRTLAQVTAKLGQLAHIDAQAGVSDGRETERRAIFAGLDELTGSKAATDQLFENALYLFEHSAPILSLEVETEIVNYNITQGHGDYTGTAKK